MAERAGDGLSSIERVAREAARLGLDIDILTLEQSTRTAEDAAEACRCDVAQIVKSLVFADSRTGSLVLLLVSGSNQVDLEYVRDRHGLMLERCDAKRVRLETGFAIGGVSPIGHINPIAVKLDRTLLRYPIVFAAAGRPDSVFSVEPHALMRVTGASDIDVTPEMREIKPIDS